MGATVGVAVGGIGVGVAVGGTGVGGKGVGVRGAGVGVEVGSRVAVAVGTLGARPQAVDKSKIRPKAMTIVDRPNLRIIVHL